MHMRKISRRMTCCYYPSWKHSDCKVAHYTPLEQLDVFRLYGGGGGGGGGRGRPRYCRLASASSSVVVPLCPAVPRTAPDTPTLPSAIISWFLDCKRRLLHQLSFVAYFPFLTEMESRFLHACVERDMSAFQLAA